MGGINQPVQYVGISSLCFACGRVGNKAKSYPYRVLTPASSAGEKEMANEFEKKDQTSTDVKAFGP